MGTVYHIVYADTSFWHEPWPGYRRSGPLLTKSEAIAQAVSDVLSGAGIPEGIWTANQMGDGLLASDEEGRSPSDQQLAAWTTHDLPAGSVSQEEILEAAEKERTRRTTETQKRVQEDVSAFRHVLATNGVAEDQIDSVLEMMGVKIDA